MKKRKRILSILLILVISVGTFQLDFSKISASELLGTDNSENTTEQNSNSNSNVTQVAETDEVASNSTLSTETSVQGTYLQKAIALSMGSNETERNITWYSNDTNPGSLQLAKQSDMTGTDFPIDKSITFTANVQATNDVGLYSNQLTINQLQAGTNYIYRIVNGNTISNVYHFQTGSEGSFHFLLAGDPQIGASGNSANDTNGWDNTLTKAISNFPNTDFIVSAGDQVNTATDESQYSGFLEHDVLKSFPIATVIGNHDSASAAYSQHFNNSNDGVYGATTAGTDYWYVYNNTLFMNLNTNNLSTAEHKAFMEEAIANNPGVNWKVVVFHHSIYSVASHATQDDILQRREALAPILKELNIDVVLMGHDHVYDRSYIMDGLTPIVQKNSDGSALSSVTDPAGVLYITVNSASGSKFYAIQNQSFEYVAVKSQENVPNISNVEVTKTSFRITTYRTNDMSVVDTFEIKHTENTPTPSVEPSPSVNPAPSVEPSPTVTPVPTTNPTNTPTPTLLPVPTAIPNPVITTTPTPSSSLKKISDLSIQLANDKYVYNGISQLPEVVVTDGSTILKKGTDYTLSYMNNQEVGTGTITVTGINKYTGTATKEFTINPKTTDIQISDYSTDGIYLIWDKVRGASGYEIYRSDLSGDNYQLIKSISTTQLADKNLKNASTYTYKLRAFQIVNGKAYYSEYSNPVVSSTSPISPSVKLQKTKKSISITWNKVYGASGYQVYVSNSKNGTYKNVVDTNETSYQLKNLTAGKTYYIKVRAYKVEGTQIYDSPLSRSKSILIK